MGSVHQHSDECVAVAEPNTLESSVAGAVRRFNEDPTSVRLIEIIKKASGELVARFPSAEGHHYITCGQSGELLAVYIGPHGPENRLIKISEAAIDQLLQHADAVSIHKTNTTELAEDTLVSKTKSDS